METTQISSPNLKSGGKGWPILILLLVICYGVAAAASLMIFHNLHTWYPLLVKPGFNPPNWIYAPVWAVLYTLMAVAAWFAWRATRKSRRDISENLARLAARKDALALFCIQLLLNLTWVFAFFHLHRLLVAVMVLLLLWIAIAATMFLFWRIRQLAGALLLPYLAWISFVIALNLVLLRLN